MRTQKLHQDRLGMLPVTPVNFASRLGIAAAYRLEDGPGDPRSNCVGRGRMNSVVHARSPDLVTHHVDDGADAAVATQSHQFAVKPVIRLCPGIQIPACKGGIHVVDRPGKVHQFGVPIA